MKLLTLLGFERKQAHKIDQSQANFDRIVHKAVLQAFAK